MRLVGQGLGKEGSQIGVGFVNMLSRGYRAKRASLNAGLRLTGRMRPTDEDWHSGAAWRFVAGTGVPLLESCLDPDRLPVLASRRARKQLATRATAAVRGVEGEHAVAFLTHSVAASLLVRGHFESDGAATYNGDQIRQIMLQAIPLPDDSLDVLATATARAVESRKQRELEVAEPVIDPDIRDMHRTFAIHAVRLLVGNDLEDGAWAISDWRLGIGEPVDEYPRLSLYENSRWRLWAAGLESDFLDIFEERVSKTVN